MPRFEPFRGLRYDLGRCSLADVTAPPYDVLSGADRAALAARSDRNAVLVDVPDPADGDQRYRSSAERLDAWTADGSLVVDPAPCFTVYRMGYVDDRGRPAHTLGVIGALELAEPDAGDILPHEHTTPKARSDRLDLLRATGANLSAVWALSLTDGLTALLEVPQPPLQAWTDDDGVDHSVWRIDDPARVRAISEAVGRTPVVVADGHHRYETSLAYRDERRRAAADGSAGGAESMLCFVVELVADQLTVRPIHRLLTGLPDDLDLLDALAPWFDDAGPAPVGPHLLDRMDAAGALALLRPERDARLLVPRPEALTDAADLDSSRLEVALRALDVPVTITYQHGVDQVTAAVAGGSAQAGVLLRPATVAQIDDNAHAGRRMPAKTTFFHPKPKTGLVYRRT